MRLLVLSLCLILSACEGFEYNNKYNVVTQTPDSSMVTPPPNCPDWSGHIDGGAGNKPHSNYGCTTVTNYGAMVANPNDLVMGRGRMADSVRGAIAVKNYNSGAAASGAESASTSDSSSDSSSGAEQ